MQAKSVKIFVINLKSSTDRRKVMEQQLQKLGLPFEIFDAVRGADLSEDQVLEYYDKEYYNNRPDYFTAGAVGCTMSHFFIYQKIVAEQIEVALILEDDMVLNKNISGMLDIMAQKIRNDEVILLFYQSYFPINISAATAEPLDQKYKLYQVSELKGLRSTGGYLINYEGAKSMAEKLRPFSFFADDWITFYQKRILNGVRIAYPFLLNNTYQATTISPNTQGGFVVKTLIPFFEKNKVPVFYQLLRWRRKINIIKTRKVALQQTSPVDFREN